MTYAILNWRVFAGDSDLESLESDEAWWGRFRVCLCIKLCHTAWHPRHLNPRASTTFDWYIPCYQKLQKFYIMLYTRSFILPFLLESFDIRAHISYGVFLRMETYWTGVLSIMFVYIYLAIWYLTYDVTSPTLIKWPCHSVDCCSKSLGDNCDRAYIGLNTPFYIIIFIPPFIL